jgi:hypothetical protein
MEKSKRTITIVSRFFCRERGSSVSPKTDLIFVAFSLFERDWITSKLLLDLSTAYTLPYLPTLLARGKVKYLCPAPASPIIIPGFIPIESFICSTT